MTQGPRTSIPCCNCSMGIKLAARAPRFLSATNSIRQPTETRRSRLAHATELALSNAKPRSKVIAHVPAQFDVYRLVLESRASQKTIVGNTFIGHNCSSRVHGEMEVCELYDFNNPHSGQERRKQTFRF